MDELTDSEDTYAVVYDTLNTKYKRRKSKSKKRNFTTAAKTIRDKNDPIQVTRDAINKMNEHYHKEDIFNKKRNRVFLGECVDEEDLSVLQSVHIWKSRRTGKLGLDKFRRIVDFVSFTLKIFNCKNCSKLTDHESILFFIDTHTHEKQRKESDLLFDVSPYRSIGQKSFVNSVKDVLQKNPCNRTETDIVTLLHVLRNFRKFSSYPLHVQKGLCQKAWYSKFDSSHVIAREGNTAEFYYLILSGVVVSRCLGTSNSIGAEERRRQLAEFHRSGDIIGEREILTDTPRSGTYVTKEPVEVLGLESDVLLEIFKSTGVSDCIYYLRLIPELHDFPLELLQTNHFSCSTHYYKRGSVIVKNSNDAEWVYVIKSGSCQAFLSFKAPDKVDKPTQCRKKPAYLPSLEDKGTSKSRKLSDDHRTSKHITKEYTRTQLPIIEKEHSFLISQSYKEQSLNESSEKSPRRTKRETQRVDNDQQTYYAKIDLLTERMCFGLHSLVFDNTPNISLVSNGAECILISKQFLRDNIDKDIRHKLREKITPYPSISQIQSALSDKQSWELFKGRVLNDVLN